jgi:hypothetical protein
MKTMIRTFPRCIIWDPLGEYVTDYTFIDLEEFIDFLIKDEQKRGFFCVNYHPIDEVSDFPVFCRAVLARGDVRLVVEELDVVTSPYNCPIEFARIIKYGRHYGVQLMGASRRPAEVTRMFTSQANRFIAFAQHEPADLQYFRSIFGKAANNLSIMPDYHFMDVDYSTKPLNLSVRKPI